MKDMVVTFSTRKCCIVVEVFNFDLVMTVSVSVTASTSGPVRLEGFLGTVRQIGFGGLIIHNHITIFG